MKIHWLYIVPLFIFSLSCSDGSDSGTATSLSHLPKVCPLSAIQSPSDCFSVVDFESIATPDEYIYKDPFNSDLPDSQDPYQYIAPNKLIDLENTPADLQLNTYFKVDELMQKRKGRYALFSNLVLNALNKMRSEFGQKIIINSGYRSPNYNKSLYRRRSQNRSAKWSRHTYGDAVDISTTSRRNRNKIFKLCKKNGASFRQKYNTHVHCDWRNSNLDLSFFPPVLRPSSHQEEPLEESVLAELSILKTPVGTDLQLSSIYNHHVQEDHGELLYEWEITLPTGELLYSEQREPFIPLIKGTYVFRLTVGGSVSVEKRWLYQQETP